ncbi:uncharacterized protein EV422DRAFT_513927 [Fimicolochytrium jonesii]|uniref:uncharacterized protein n=1 Tax=Fimicolochytrium jonesii TaxID=1396493 RepID=UPI0022FEB284|nr:uncharacterized protein EV422DRAFT_513927 [Fimicolochytrium jonesii]KAI8825711.1 hypothetical protein EV422DRAFT_513927 [Fimicolochytrium jonesii]
MPLPRNFITAETLKFGVYILFPVGVLYLFNRPDLQERLTKEQMDTINTFRVPEDQLFKLPSNMTEVREETARLRRLRQERKQQQTTETSSSA